VANGDSLVNLYITSAKMVVGVDVRRIQITSPAEE
jgi:hypothetical protein